MKMNIEYVFVFVSIYRIISIPINSPDGEKVVLSVFQENSRQSAYGGKDVVSLFQENPMQLVSLMSKVDPDQLLHIITLLEGMVATSQNLESKLRNNLVFREKELGHANTALDDAETKLMVISEQKEEAIAKRDQRKSERNSKKGELILAQKELDDQLPSLNSEQETLQQVIGILHSLIDDNYKDNNHNNCAAHHQCNDDQFCYQGVCANCDECHYHHDAIDGQCPEKCPVLCEDNPPQYPKCPICQDQEECDELNGDFQDEENLPYPQCEDGRGICQITSDCHDAAFDYQKILKKRMMDWYFENPGETEKPNYQAWPGAGESFCVCMNEIAQCVRDNHCSKELPEDEEFTVHEMCTQAFKCSDEHCGWAKFENHKAFLSKKFPWNSLA